MNIYKKFLALAALLVLLSPWSVSAESLTIYAAGSLKEAMDEVAASYEKTYATKVSTKFGPNGLLRKPIAEGGNPDVLASADMDHPKALQLTGGPNSAKAPEGHNQYG